jgi:hypothetical protein
VRGDINFIHKSKQIAFGQHAKLTAPISAALDAAWVGKDLSQNLRAEIIPHPCVLKVFLDFLREAGRFKRGVGLTPVLV